MAPASLCRVLPPNFNPKSSLMPMVLNKVDGHAQHRVPCPCKASPAQLWVAPVARWPWLVVAAVLPATPPAGGRC